MDEYKYSLNTYQMKFERKSVYSWHLDAVWGLEFYVTLKLKRTKKGASDLYGEKVVHNK